MSLVDQQTHGQHPGSQRSRRFPFERVSAADMTGDGGVLIAGGTTASLTAGNGEQSALLYFLLTPKEAGVVEAGGLEERSSSRGTEGSNPSPSSGESTANLRCRQRARRDI
jgi:hypothetical protein